jgi:hypothetical protein
MTALDAELRAFSLRNEQRACTVEIDESDLGAQILGHALRLVGATYDRAARIVSLMFGASELTGYHLTHSIPDVTAVDINADGDGRDRVLRIRSEKGQVLVLLE